jgi:hypothetical protein
MSAFQDVMLAKEMNKEMLLHKPNVIGVGAGYKTVQGSATQEICIVALVKQKMSQSKLTLDAAIPRDIKGYPTDVLEVGDVVLHGRLDRTRPAMPGISIGHYKITAGTFGAVVRDRRTGQRLLLSNNHVFANSNDAKLSDPILQPGPSNGGTAPGDVIATLERFKAIYFGEDLPPSSIPIEILRMAQTLGLDWLLKKIGLQKPTYNLVDAAVARPVDDSQISDEIMDIGKISGTKEAQLGMKVRKSGRTTGLTTGTVMVMGVTFRIGYGPGKMARFENQVMTTAMSKPGDSGSLVVADDSLQAVGLLFGGSEQATIFSPIQAVMDALDITL